MKNSCLIIFFVIICITEVYSQKCKILKIDSTSLDFYYLIQAQLKKDTVAILSLKKNSEDGEEILVGKNYCLNLKKTGEYVHQVVNGDSVLYTIMTRSNIHIKNDILIWDKNREIFPYIALNLKGLSYRKKKCFGKFKTN